MATANPAMNEAVYQRAGFADSSTSVMTIDGTVLKTAILMVILVAAPSAPGRRGCPPLPLARIDDGWISRRPGDWPS